MTSTTRLTGAALTRAQEAFAAQLAAFDRIFHRVFRQHRGADHADLVAEARGTAWKAWASLAAQGATRPRSARGTSRRSPSATSWVAAPSPVAPVAGRIATSCTRSSSENTVSGSSRSTAPARDSETAAAIWDVVLQTSLKTSVPRQVAFKLDFLDWLEQIPQRKRCMAKLLAEGHDTTAVAKALGVTPGAVSQSRTWLERSWRQFQAGPTALPVPPRQRDLRGRKPGLASTAPSREPPEGPGFRLTRRLDQRPR